MNEEIKKITIELKVDASETDIEKLSIAIIKKCAELNDTWIDSGKSLTFGGRLKSHFGISD